MKETLTEPQVRAILQSLDDALEKGPWEKSSFLRVIGKNLQEIRDNLSQEIEKSFASSEAVLQKNEGRPRLQKDQKEVFISLYSTDGTHMISWERILANLPKQIISRPIYSDEEGAQTHIKSKENKFNEAYVAIIVNESDILKLSVDKTSVDKFGKPLLALKDRAILLENVSRFVHVSGDYHYSKGHLHKIVEES